MNRKAARGQDRVQIDRFSYFGQQSGRLISLIVRHAASSSFDRAVPGQITRVALNV
jgi:hypothetical protein